jgi:hypothetical protein
MPRRTTMSQLGQRRVLLVVIACQWLLLTLLWTSKSQLFVVELGAISQASRSSDWQVQGSSVVATQQGAGEDKHSSSSSNSLLANFSGVALGIVVQRPRWYTKRYTVWVHNALANLPNDDWAVQLLVAPAVWESQILPQHPALQRIVEEKHPRIVVTALPRHLQKRKAHDVLRDPWVWEHVVGERVLIIHGDGVICGNAATSLAALAHLDYVGLPWARLDGAGGDGRSLSLRSRSAMQASLAGASSPGTSPDAFFVTRLLQLNAKAVAAGQSPPYKIASPAETQAFGGVAFLQAPHNQPPPPSQGPPLVVAGTYGHLSQSGRNWLLGSCPELKQVFPSLHHPSCFGARPNAAKCANVTLGV